jgi:hypothetical protein
MVQGGPDPLDPFGRAHMRFLAASGCVLCVAGFALAQDGNVPMTGKKAYTVRAVPSACPPESTGHTDRSDDGSSWTSLHDTLTSDGYVVNLEQTDPRKLKVLFSKEGKTADGKGLLKFKWDKQVTGQAIYVCSDSKWNLVDVNAKAQEKPPLLGDWTPIAGDPEASSIISTFHRGYDIVK